MAELRGTSNGARVFVHVEASIERLVGPTSWPANNDVEKAVAEYRELLDRVAGELRLAGFLIRNAIVSVNYADGFEPPGHRESRA